MNARINTYPVQFNKLVLHNGQRATGFILQIIIPRPHNSRGAGSLHLAMAAALRKELKDGVLDVAKPSNGQSEIRVSGVTYTQLLSLLRKDGFKIGRA